MKHLLIFTVVIFSVNSELTEKLELTSFSWSNCGSDDPITVKSLIVSPDPIVVPGNVTVNVEVVGTVGITSPTKFDILIEKRVDESWVEIPCMHHLGSCHYDDICVILEKLFGDSDTPCPQSLQDHGIPCHCPIEAGTYNVKDFTVDIALKHLPHMVEGDYHIHHTLSTDKELDCVDIYATLKLKPA